MRKARIKRQGPFKRPLSFLSNVNIKVSDFTVTVRIDERVDLYA